MTPEEAVESLQAHGIDACWVRPDYILGGFNDDDPDPLGIRVWVDCFAIRPRMDAGYDCILPGPNGHNFEEAVPDLEAAIAWVLRVWRPRPRIRMPWEHARPV